MARREQSPATRPAIKSSDAIPVSSSNARWNLTASGVGFGVILIALAAVAIVGMRVSWVPLRDTADTIGLHEVRQFYPLVIDLLAGLAVVASIALYGSSGYRWAIGTVVGLTAISLMLNVAHGSAAARIDASSDWPTWGHVILASAAPVICIGLGTHLAALTWGRVAAAHRALRGSAAAATRGVAASGAGPAFQWPVTPLPGARVLDVVAAVAAICAPVAVTPVRTPAWVGAAPAGVRLLDAWPLCCAIPVADVAPPLPTRGELLTTSEAAERLNVSPNTVRSYKHRGTLVPVTADPGGGHLFDARDVERLRGAP